MITRPIPRYAIYYSPEPGSPLDTFGHAWLGDNGKTGAAATAAGNGTSRNAPITGNTRRYGFHGTFKPPFELNPSTSPESLLETAKVFARSLSPVEIPPLELAVIGKFIALTPTKQSAALEKLAAACVRAFEAFRKPATDDEVKNYKLNKLTVHQEQMLEHWGYPYVMEEFRFHISMTDRIDSDAERDAAMATLQRLGAPVLGKSIIVREITVFSQSGFDQPMVPTERIPFGRTK